ncbi:DUF2591 domain-containing protein [Lelliottia amnigena]|uniref:phage protein NinX family protein n=1 Tax=Lelliottia amnigena TaxID=61646 RepID=UPI001F284121|nr:phage protein NinX family protein [Lelliottia amnigena]UJD93682.1 DUF2591 domain-containing protein [Lelliottia amnigena]
MDYSKLSDVEINHAVASVLPGRYVTYPDHVMNSETEEDFDPCNNPEDAWPIISQNNITLHAPMPYDDPQEWLCFAVNNSDVDCMNTNPLRGAMIVFLKMQDSSNVPANPAGPDIR